jgi:5-formyltetrahydrofolate cyclo-ligase
VPPAQKSALRKQLLAQRAQRTAAELVEARRAIAARVFELARTQGWRTVAAYRPLRTEPGSAELLDGLLAAGVAVITPVLLDDRDLGWTTEPTATDRLGPDAVGRADAVLVPALAVSPTGTRLGRGGGSYDRALARVPASVMTYALIFDDELLGEVPADSWDRAVQAAITPSGVRQLGRLDAE